MKNLITKFSCRWIIYITILFNLAACQENEAQVKETFPRPVSYVPLKIVQPMNHSYVAGSVVAWKKESVGFDVNGHVQFVEEPGTIVHGNRFDEDGQVVEAGSLLASLKDNRYQIRVDQAKAKIQEINASYKQSQKSYERQKKLLEQGAGAQQYVDDSLASLRSYKAQLRAAEDELREAKLNSADTALYAPFSGEIARAHVIPGGYVERGEPVVTLQMMDPIKVAVAVSPELENQINYNDLAKIYIEGNESPLQGWVWNKAPVADSVTRTFIVTMLVRNRRLEVGMSEELAKQDIARTYSLQNIEFKNENGEKVFYINAESIHEDESGHYVWKAEGLEINDLNSEFDPVFRVSKVRVKLGKRSYPFMQILTYQEVEDMGTLDPERDLLIGTVSRDIEPGEAIALSRERWQLRPGQIVNVDLAQKKIAKGFYVPAQSIVKKADKKQIYVIKEINDEGQYAQKIDVKVGENSGTLIKVEPVSADDLQEGMKLVVDGAQYLQNGEYVKAYKSAMVNL